VHQLAKQHTNAALRDAPQSALQHCAQLDESLAVLDELLKAPPADGPAASPKLPSSDGLGEAVAARVDPAAAT
jgi:hypothetical protein